MRQRLSRTLMPPCQRLALSLPVFAFTDKEGETWAMAIALVVGLLIAAACSDDRPKGPPPKAPWED